MKTLVWLACMCLCACPPPVKPTSDAGTAVVPGPTDGLDASVVDAGGCRAVPDAPVGRLQPEAGELFYAQIGLGGFSMGESAIAVGPDGTVVIIDVGNNSHDDDIATALLDITGRTSVDHIVITHLHADHADGLSGLLNRVSLKGRLVHRGLTDLTPAANAATIDALCTTLSTRPEAGLALCEAAAPAPCQAAMRTGTSPAISCAALGNTSLALGASARLDFLAANGSIGAESDQTLVGPILTNDSNGENARSVVGLLTHGPFRMLFAGDLTGGQSSTDDLESFYASRLSAVPSLGVDVLHAGHHGRDTSSNAAWVARLLPADSRSRNVVIGISTAHLGSPHAEPLTRFVENNRLGSGRMWATTVAATGANAPALVNAAGGLILLRTLNGGEAYAVQAIGANGTVLESRTYRSVSACP